MKKLFFSFSLFLASCVSSCVNAAFAQTPAVPVPVVQPLSYSPAAYGVIGDGKTDDTVAWQKCIDTVPDLNRIDISPSMHSVITAPLKVYSRTLRFVCPGQPDTVGLGGGCGEFVWKGPAGAQALFVCNYARCCTFEGLTFSCDGSATPPACGILFDEFQDASKPKPTLVCTRNVVRRCYVAAPNVAGSFYCVAIALASPTNCEYHIIEGCTFTSRSNKLAWGEGVHVGNSANAKGIIVRDTSCSWSNIGFHWLNGSGHCDGCTGTGNVIADIQFENFADPSTAFRCDFEQSNMAANIANGQGAPYLFLANRWGSVTGQAAFNIHNQQTVMLCNKVAGTPLATIANQLAFQQYPNTAFALWRCGNIWPGGKMLVNDSWFGQIQAGPVEWVRPY